MIKRLSPTSRGYSICVWKKWLETLSAFSFHWFSVLCTCGLSHFNPGRRNYSVKAVTIQYDKMRCVALFHQSKIKMTPSGPGWPQTQTEHQFHQCQQTSAYVPPPISWFHSWQKLPTWHGCDLISLSLLDCSISHPLVMTRSVHMMSDAIWQRVLTRSRLKLPDVYHTVSYELFLPLHCLCVWFPLGSFSPVRSD